MGKLGFIHCLRKAGSHNNFMPLKFGRHVALAVASLAILIAFSACKSTSSPVENVTPITWPTPAAPETATNLIVESIQTNQVVAPPQPTPKPEPLAQTPPSQPPIIEPEPEPAFTLPAGLIPVDLWTTQTGLPNLQLIRSTTPPLFKVETTQGSLCIVTGQRFAKWNNLIVCLGYPPIIQKGKLLVNSLDVLKTFHPLLTEKLALRGTNRVLVIDPGHGGVNPGAKSAVRNLWEKDLTLDWALRIERLLTESGWHVVLTRRNDTDVSLPDRIGLAEQVQADLFISLHFNSLEHSGGAASHSQEGIETYCLTPAGMPSNIVRESIDDDPRKSFPNNSFDSENLLLAARMQSSMVKATARKDRGVRRARFMTVLREQKRPAVLLEGGFLSSSGEAALISDPKYREALAQAVCDALPN
jgi:N-acetylmuramoyl-L-alanine amidase